MPILSVHVKPGNLHELHRHIKLIHILNNPYQVQMSNIKTKIFAMNKVSVCLIIAELNKKNIQTLNLWCANTFDKTWPELIQILIKIENYYFFNFVQIWLATLWPLVVFSVSPYFSWCCRGPASSCPCQPGWWIGSQPGHPCHNPLQQPARHIL